jgi:hypothetical protein
MSFIKGRLQLGQEVAVRPKEEAARCRLLVDETP